MNSDAKKLNPSTREYYDDELSNLRSQYSKFVSELRKKQTLAAKDPYFRQGSQIEKNNEKAQSITENLDEAIRLGNDSITTANATMTTLLEDRKHIDHINENLDIIHAEAITGTERAKRMVRRACFNNCLIWSIVVFLVALLGFSLYWKLRKTQK
ncbi:Vesicle transport v-SNARE protein [Tritrichomonas foetus]|uniref:Vesicle transport v-SNARE protein n=1 Tax=Tritrichomonas foetus TaxID=1144522 RepID=A0A1J4K6G8_9EUKA|nr:Vesicle transport v-SNARE protein [Tritrichomonas foetus]|eukprot:OHT05302.1 Vesicle transport v-SNARE protein [Tritrichomonas foetus]